MESENIVQETNDHPIDETSNHHEREIDNNQSSAQQKPVEESQTVYVQNQHNASQTENVVPQKEAQSNNQQSIEERNEEKIGEAVGRVEPMEEQLPVDKKTTEAKFVPIVENDTITYKSANKLLKLTLKKSLLRFTIQEVTSFAPESQNGAKNLEQLLNPPLRNNNNDKTEVFTISHKELMLLTSGLFRNCQYFFTFLVENLSNQNIVLIKDDMIKFKLKPEDENSSELKLNFKKIITKKLENEKIQVNLNGIQEKLLQFELKEIELIERIQKRWRKKQMNSNEISEQQPEEQSNMEQNDINYESEDDLLDDEQEEWIDIDKIKKEIENLENQFQQFGKKFKIPTYTQPKSAEKAFSVASMASTPSKPELNLFPPGYLPPHLSRPQSHNIPGTENINSAEHLRFQANQTKKAKLKMAKEMLKLGYSTAEVIQRIEAQQRSGKDDPSAFTPPSSRKSFMPPSTTSTYQPSAPSVSSHQIEKAPSQNDRVVREMFKKLLKQKRYKKLDEIQKHMEREGIHTSVAELKKILNEIRASNAQRQKAEKQSQAE